MRDARVVLSGEMVRRSIESLVSLSDYFGCWP